MRENINSNFYIPSVKYTYTTLPVNFQRNQITDNTITSSRSNKSMTHFPHLRKIRYFTRVVIIKPLIRFFFFFRYWRAAKVWWNRWRSPSPMTPS